MHAYTRWAALASILGALAVLATACGEDDGGYSEADITFLQDMIPHHEDAVAMAHLVPDRTDRPELLAMADDIIATQQAEISQMQTMLEDAGATDDAHGAHDDDGAHEGMDGMMTDEQMSGLEGLEGDAFDLMFIDLMIEHHQGAIDAAEEVVQGGRNAEVRALAEEVIAAQQAEVDRMTAWRQEWAGDA